jgi:hypothetical protein
MWDAKSAVWSSIKSSFPTVPTSAIAKCFEDYSLDAGIENGMMPYLYLAWRAICPFV